MELNGNVHIQWDFRFSIRIRIHFLANKSVYPNKIGSFALVTMVTVHFVGHTVNNSLLMFLPQSSNYIDSGKLPS